MSTTKVPLRLVKELQAYIDERINLKMDGGLQGDVLGINDNIVAWYSFDELSGTTVTDSHINGLDGTSNGVTVAQIGVNNNSYAFDGINDYVSIAHNSLFNFTDSVTIAAFVKLSYNGSSQEIVSMPYATDVFGAPFYSYSLHVLNSTETEGSVRFWLNTSEGYRTSGTTTLTYDDWHFVVGTYDGSTVRISVDDGKYSKETTYGTVGTIVNYTNPLFIGKVGSDTQFLKGNVDSVILLDTVLTKAQESSLYNNGNGVTYSQATGGTNFYSVTIQESYLNDATVDNSGSIATESRYYYSGDVCTLLSAFPSTGSNFIGYFYDSSASSPVGSFNVSQNTTIYAVYDYVETTNTVEDGTEIYDFGTSATYFVAANGSDSNDGLTTSTPKLTVASALSAYTTGSGGTIALRAGDSFYHTSEVSISKSGNATTPLKIGAYGSGAKPKIFGGSNLSGWTLYSGSIWQCTPGFSIGQLFMDGTRIPLASNGYHNVDSSTSTSATSSTINSSINHAGATMIYRDTNYTFSAKSITGSSGTTLNFASTSIANNQGFILVNKLEYITSENQWYYDSGSGKVYVWLPGGFDPNSHTMFGSRVSKMFNTSGAPSYIKFENLNLFGFNDCAISLYANNIEIDSCYIHGSKWSGVAMPAPSYNTFSVTNCTFKDCASNAIRDLSASTTGTTVYSNNYVENIGLRTQINEQTQYGGWGVGISSGSTVATIEHNTIKNIGYNGINGKAPYIRYNYVDQALLTLTDGAGIYVQGSSSNGLVISDNIVRNCIGEYTGSGYTYSFAGAGIYLDDNAINVTIQNNYVEGCDFGYFLHNSNGCELDSNKAFNCGLGVYLHTVNGTANSMTNNEIYCLADADPPMPPYLPEDRQFVVMINNSAYPSPMTGNKYWNNSDVNVFLIGGGGTPQPFSTWVGNAGDTGAVMHDSFTGVLEGYYNETTSNKTINLSGTYTDESGNFISSFVLTPFTGRVVVKVA